MATEPKFATKPRAGVPHLNAGDYERMVRGINEYAMFLVRPGGTAGHFASWNPGVERILGYGEAEWIELPGEVIFVPEDREKGVPQRELATAAIEGEANDNRWHLRADGSRVWVNGAVTCLREPGGEVYGFVKVMRDNTREKLADEALRRAHDELEQRVEERTSELNMTVQQLSRSEARFVRAFQAAPFAAVITSRPDHVLLEANDAFCDLTGYNRDESLGRSSKELGLWSSQEDQKKLNEAYQAGRDFRDVELKIRTKSGDIRTILASGAEIDLETESGTLKLFYDITERKRTEEQLMRAIQDAMQDTAWFARSVMQRLVEVRSGGLSPQHQVDLTPRERQVLERIAKGLNNEAISAELGIAPQTVRNYVATIYGKIDVRSRAEAVVWARERGLVA